MLPLYKSYQLEPKMLPTIYRDLCDIILKMVQETFAARSTQIKMNVDLNKVDFEHRLITKY